MAILFNMLIGLGLLAISGMMFWAGSAGWGSAFIRQYIQTRFLGGKDLMDPTATYATEIRFLRWPLLVAALTTVIPMTMFAQDIEILLIYVVGYLIVRLLMLAIDILKSVKRFFTAKADREEHHLSKLKGKSS